MTAIRSAGTKPEMIVRRLAHKLGYRFRLHRKNLPGKPDLVFVSRRKIIFVHGCFWHLHPKATCHDARVPQSNTAYWQPKLERNVTRDQRNSRDLVRLGWKVLVVWECDTCDLHRLGKQLYRFLRN